MVQTASLLCTRALGYKCESAARHYSYKMLECMGKILVRDCPNFNAIHDSGNDDQIKKNVYLRI